MLLFAQFDTMTDSNPKTENWITLPTMRRLLGISTTQLTSLRTQFGNRFERIVEDQRHKVEINSIAWLRLWSESRGVRPGDQLADAASSATALDDPVQRKRVAEAELTELKRDAAKRRTVPIEEMSEIVSIMGRHVRRALEEVGWIDPQCQSIAIAGLNAAEVEFKERFSDVK